MLYACAKQENSLIIGVISFDELYLISNRYGEQLEQVNRTESYCHKHRSYLWCLLHSQCRL